MEQDRNKIVELEENHSILDSAVQATEENTRSGTISDQTNFIARMQKLNAIIDECLRSRRNSTNYKMLYEIASRMTHEIHISDRSNNPIRTEMDIETVKSITLDFLKFIDEDFYNKANAIINGEDPIELKTYKKTDIKDFEENDEEGIPKYSKIACVWNNGKKTIIFIPLEGTIEDVYLLVHEISHTFDLNVNNDSKNGTRNILGEVTPAVFEALLSKYLIERGYRKDDIYAREKGGIISKYDDSVETYAKLVLMDLKKHKEKITIEDMQKIQKEANVSDNVIEYIIGRILNSPKDVDYRARYMIAQLVYPYIADKYEQNQQKTIEEMKEYFKAIQDNNFEKALKSLGLSTDKDTIDLLLHISNTRIENLDTKIKDISR